MAAQDLIQYIRFGLTHLPGWLQLPILADTSGGDTVRSLKLKAAPDDIRTIVSYPAGPHVAIDQTATHSHVDELAHMPFPDRTWSSIQTTIAPTGSCHIVTRGAGDDDFVVRLWEAAQEEASNLFPFFAPWSARPRATGWREAQELTLPMQGLLYFAPESPEDALAGDETSIYIPMEVWDRCRDPNLPALEDDFDTPLVLGVDASVSGDMFGIVVVSRHPDRPAEAAIRFCKAWKPGDFADGRIDFEEVERFIRFVCGGGCPNRHPRSLPDPICGECKDGNFTRRGYNVVQVTYDPYQMVEMAQRFRREGIWCHEFSQTGDRLIADAQLHQLAMRRTISHNGDPKLREHISNARAKLSKDEDTKMRIVKKSPSRKIDLAVAASMAVAQILYLNL